jgi:Uma2 family endonuclease
MSVTTRSRAEQHAFNERRWTEILSESFVDGSISKIETDREGNVIMSPSAGKDHGDRQAEIVHQLRLLLPVGGVLTECGVSTQEGNKTPDISWISVHHPQFRQPDVKVLNPAAEVCVVVLSPSNSAEEIDLKRWLYFQEAAQEVWICGLEGEMKFFSAAGGLEASKLCPKFPKRILTSHERLDLEHQKEVSRKTTGSRQTLRRTPDEPGRGPPGPEAR